MRDVETLYTPPDVAEAYASWECSCGPAAFAAIIRRPAMQVQRYFPAFPARDWCNPTQMYVALASADAEYTKHGTAWPDYGLLFLQLEGPWEAPGVPVTVAYRHTHWIAYCSSPTPMVYDINNGPSGGWWPGKEWKAKTMPRILVSVKRSTGWRVRASIRALAERDGVTK